MMAEASQGVEYSLMTDDYPQRLRAFYEELRRDLPPEAISTHDVDRVTHSVDGSKAQAYPDIVVRPGTQQEAIDAVSHAGRFHIPIYPRGSGSGLTGGAVPTRGGMVLDLARLKRIVAMDTRNLTATCEAGITAAELDAEAAKHGLFYAPYPGSAAFSTIGGNIAENAGGMRACKYGVTRESVLALKCVLPSGQVFTTGSRALKSVTGYDLVRLLTGSEGTLAVILEATLRLIPRPKHVGTLLAFFAEDVAALTAAETIIAAPLIPRALEYIGERALACVRQYRELPLLPEDAKAVLLMESDGDVEAGVSAELAVMRQHCEEGGAIGFTEAPDEEARAQIWDVRDSVSPSLYRLGDFKISEDVSVPRASLAEFVRRIEEIARQCEDCPPPVSYGHVGDGTIHVSFLLEGRDDARIPAVEQAVAEIFKLAVGMGGSLSAEHGVGLTKRKYLSIELSEIEIRLMRELKRVFDPDGILNPGKIWEE